MEETKKCSRCKRDRVLTVFSHRKDRPDELRTICNICVGQKTRYRAAHPEQFRAEKARHQAKNVAGYSQKDKERAKRYYKLHAEKMKASAAAWRKANHQAVKKHRDDYYAAHPEKAHNRQGKGSVARKLAAASNLTDEYVAKLLCRGTPLRIVDIPQELIKLKRVQLQIMRKIHEVTK